MNNLFLKILPALLFLSASMVAEVKIVETKEGVFRYQTLTGETFKWDHTKECWIRTKRKDG
jgi:hypothetical protein